MNKQLMDIALTDKSVDVINEVKRAAPGLPRERTKVDKTDKGSVELDLENLYTLIYIRNGHSQTQFTILRMSSGLTMDIIVGKAKAYCTKKEVRFMWIEKTIEVIE